MPSLDWRELAAARMTRFLASQPRKEKTRAYLASLPKRNQITVSAGEYPISRAEARKEKALQAKRDAQRYANWEARGKPPSPSVPRKDRVRPRVGRSRHAEHSPLLFKIAGYQGFACVLCGGEVLFGGEPNHPKRASIDHVLPRSRGGGDHNNRLAAHIECNQKKSNALPSGCELVWLAFVNARLKADNSPPPTNGQSATKVGQGVEQ